MDDHAYGCGDSLVHVAPVRRRPPGRHALSRLVRGAAAGGAALLLLASAASARAEALGRVCVWVDRGSVSDRERPEHIALVDALREALARIGYAYEDRACAPRVEVVLRLDGAAWEVEAWVEGETRTFVASSATAASELAVDVARFADQRLSAMVVPRVERRRHGMAPSAPERGTVFFAAAGAIVSSLDHVISRYDYESGVGQVPVVVNGHVDADRRWPIATPTLALALRLNAEARVSMQLEAGVEMLGAQRLRFGPFYGDVERATYLTMPALARYRLQTGSVRDRHLYFGGEIGVRLTENQFVEVAFVPVDPVWSEPNDQFTFGRVMTGVVFGVQLERRARILSLGAPTFLEPELRRREVDVRFAGLSAWTAHGPRFGASLGVRWRFGR